MHAFERGQLQRRIPVKSQDEIADISRCFNKMADTVVESMNEIKKTDKLRRELVANVSHDLRSPLASIQGYLETIDMKKENLPPEELNSYIETALKNTRMLNKMINNLFDLSKLDAKNVIPNLEYVCFAELVQDLVQVFEPIASQKNVTLKAELPENPQVRIHADVSLMERALSNLIENAIEHTPEGGSVTLQTVQEGEDIELKINDTGDGIDQKDLPFVFDRFYQVDKSRSNSKGAGLGLSIAKKILDLHGAKISIDSLLNHGTTFIIRMPSLN
jgi:signal transduction histidine kinase